MNYLKSYKLFESSTEYQEITTDEYNIFTIGVVDYEDELLKSKQHISDYWVNFTQKELNKIKELLPDAHFCKEIETDRNNARIDSKKSGLIMIKLKDEWYYVLMGKYSYSMGGYRYFKCDQFDGLIKLIKDHR